MIEPTINDIKRMIEESEEPISKFRCVACKQELQQLTDGDEWITSNGAIFCEVTKEIHYREKVEI